MQHRQSPPGRCYRLRLARSFEPERRTVPVARQGLQEHGGREFFFCAVALTLPTSSSAHLRPSASVCVLWPCSSRLRCCQAHGLSFGVHTRVIRRARWPCVHMGTCIRRFGEQGQQHGLGRKLGLVVFDTLRLSLCLTRCGLPLHGTYTLFHLHSPSPTHRQIRAVSRHSRHD